MENIKNTMTMGRLKIVCWFFTCSFLLLTYCSTRRSLPLEGPLALNEEQKHGEVVFMQHCERCHPQGEAGLGPAINPAPDFGKRFQIRHGLGVMPSFDEKQISDKELNNVLSYLKALKKNS
jgi:mono/diheme cytochrome c family protein